MDVFRHDDVADQAEGVADTGFVEDPDEAITSLSGTEQGMAFDAAEGDEVKITLAITAL
jgi:hypothetical protein